MAELTFPAGKSRGVPNGVGRASPDRHFGQINISHGQNTLSPTLPLLPSPHNHFSIPRAIATPKDYSGISTAHNGLAERDQDRMINHNTSSRDPYFATSVNSEEAFSHGISAGNNSRDRGFHSRIDKRSFEEEEASPMKKPRRDYPPSPINPNLHRSKPASASHIALRTMSNRFPRSGRAKTDRAIAESVLQQSDLRSVDVFTNPSTQSRDGPGATAGHPPRSGELHTTQSASTWQAYPTFSASEFSEWRKRCCTQSDSENDQRRARTCEGQGKSGGLQRDREAEHQPNASMHSRELPSETSSGQDSWVPSPPEHSPPPPPTSLPPSPPTSRPPPPSSIFQASSSVSAPLNCCFLGTTGMAESSATGNLTVKSHGASSDSLTEDLPAVTAQNTLRVQGIAFKPEGSAALTGHAVKMAVGPKWKPISWRKTNTIARSPAKQLDRELKADQLVERRLKADNDADLPVEKSYTCLPYHHPLKEIPEMTKIPTSNAPDLQDIARSRAALWESIRHGNRQDPRIDLDAMGIDEPSRNCFLSNQTDDVDAKAAWRDRDRDEGVGHFQQEPTWKCYKYQEPQHDSSSPAKESLEAQSTHSDKGCGARADTFLRSRVLSKSDPSSTVDCSAPATRPQSSSSTRHSIKAVLISDSASRLRTGSKALLKWKTKRDHTDKPSQRDIPQIRPKSSSQSSLPFLNIRSAGSSYRSTFGGNAAREGVMSDENDRASEISAKILNAIARDHQANGDQPALLNAEDIETIRSAVSKHSEEMTVVKLLAAKGIRTTSRSLRVIALAEQEEAIHAESRLIAGLEVFPESRDTGDPVARSVSGTWLENTERDTFESHISTHFTSRKPEDVLHSILKPSDDDQHQEILKQLPNFLRDLENRCAANWRTGITDAERRENRAFASPTRTAAIKAMQGCDTKVSSDRIPSLVEYHSGHMMSPVGQYLHYPPHQMTPQEIELLEHPAVTTQQLRDQGFDVKGTPFFLDLNSIQTPVPYKDPKRVGDIHMGHPDLCEQISGDPTQCVVAQALLYHHAIRMIVRRSILSTFNLLIGGHVRHAFLTDAVPGLIEAGWVVDCIPRKLAVNGMMRIATETSESTDILAHEAIIRYDILVVWRKVEGMVQIGSINVPIGHYCYGAVRPTSSLDRQKWHIVQLQDAMAGLFRKIAWGRQRDDVLTLYSENATWSKDAVPIWMERVLLRKQEIDFGLVFSWEELPENIRKMLRNVGDIPPGLEMKSSTTHIGNRTILEHSQRNSGERAWRTAVERGTAKEGIERMVRSKRNAIDTDGRDTFSRTSILINKTLADTPDDVFGDKKQAAVAKALTTKRLVDPETGLTILQKVAARQTLTRSERATKAMQSKRSKIDSQTGVSVLQSIGIKTGARLALEGTFDPTIEVERDVAQMTIPQLKKVLSGWLLRSSNQLLGRQDNMWFADLRVKDLKKAGYLIKGWNTAFSLSVNDPYRKNDLAQALQGVKNGKIFFWDKKTHARIETAST